MLRHNLMGLLLGSVLMIGLSSCSVAKVITIEEATRIAEEGAFDAESYVERTWPSVSNTIVEESVELSTLLDAMETDADGRATKENLQQVADEFGVTTAGQAHVFMVKGRGEVTGVDTESTRGTIEVALDGYDGPIEVKVYIGPRIPSDDSSVRDAVGFIDFGDFRDQTEYGKVARELNQRVIREVLEGLDREGLVGISVTFHGAFTIRTFNAPGDIDVSEISVTPVQLQVGG